MCQLLPLSTMMMRAWNAVSNITVQSAIVQQTYARELINIKSMVPVPEPIAGSRGECAEEKAWVLTHVLLSMLVAQPCCTGERALSACLSRTCDTLLYCLQPGPALPQCHMDPVPSLPPPFEHKIVLHGGERARHSRAIASFTGRPLAHGHWLPQAAAESPRRCGGLGQASALEPYGGDPCTPGTLQDLMPAACNSNAETALLCHPLAQSTVQAVTLAAKGMSALCSRFLQAADA